MTRAIFYLRLFVSTAAIMALFAATVLMEKRLGDEERAARAINGERSI